MAYIEALYVVSDRLQTMYRNSRAADTTPVEAERADTETTISTSKGSDPPSFLGSAGETEYCDRGQSREEEGRQELINVDNRCQCDEQL